MDPSLLQKFGSELRLAREASGRSVDEVARQTRIHRRYIDAIESGDVAALPPGPYVPAFLREFARAVGLKVPQEIAITSSINHGLTTTTLQSAPIVKSQHTSTSFPGAVSKATNETAKFAGNVAKSAAKTTGNVYKAVEGGVTDAVGVFTSKSLREEADLVRRERLGISKFPGPVADAIAPEEPSIADSLPEVRSEQDVEHEHGAEQEFVDSEEAAAPVARRRGLKAPMIPLEISSDDPVSGNATLRLGKSSRKFPVTNLVILMLLVVFGVVAYFALGNMREKKRGDTLESTELQDDAQFSSTAAEKTSEPTKTEVAPTVTAPLPAGGDSLQFILKATDAVWVSIGPDAAIPFRGELKAGETKSFTAKDRFTVNIGNQKALEMTFNGTRLSNLPTIKNSGMVVRNLVLTKDRVSLDGATVNTAVATTPVPVAPKEAAPTKSVATPAKPAASKPAATNIAKKPSSTIKPTSTNTAIKKKPIVSKRTTTIAPVEPKPAAVD